MQPGSIDNITKGLADAADGFKKMQIALLAFAGVCTILLIVITIKTIS